MAQAEFEGIGAVVEVPVEEEMTRSYMDYAMSVIVSRALPDVRDGLKPVQRRILWAMHEMGLGPDKPHRKSARVVGEVLGKYHPHGDMPVYEAMVRMAQDFSTRYPLVDGHGNFGSVDGDAPAAMRYTEVRLSRIAREMLRDIEKETVEFVPNFDDSLQEPSVLPSRFPNLLAGGSAGIAVGMATNIPPHNLGEVIDAAAWLIDHPDASVEDLMRFVKGPDFPTGGLIVGTDGIAEAYRTGRGSIVMRAATEIVTDKAGRAKIVVTELPFQVNKAKLIEQIAELARERRIDGIADARDETDRSGLRIVIDVRKDVNPNVVLNQLFKFTPMQQTFGANMLALVNGVPEVLTLRSALAHYVAFQKDVIERRSKYELRKAEERLHIVEGLRIALANLDAVIALIKASPTVDAARTGLMEKFNLSQKQASAILDMRLQRLVALEREKLEEEYKQLLSTIESLKTLLASDEALYRRVKEELLEIKETYADSRRTRIVEAAPTLEAEDLVVEEDVVVTLTSGGYVKRTPASVYRNQRRGGRGQSAVNTRDDDIVQKFLVASTRDQALLFTNLGRAYRLKVYDIPEHSRLAKGTALVNLAPIRTEDGEKVTALVVARSTPAAAKTFLLMVTRKGAVKRMDFGQLIFARRSGIQAISLDPGDELAGCVETSGDDEVLIVTEGGQCARFSERDVRVMGRTARGVTGIRLRDDDRVISVDKVSPGGYLLTVSDDGYGKRTPIDQYPAHSRGGKGVKTMELSRSGERERASVAAAVVVGDQDEVMICSREGSLIKMQVASEVSVKGRAARGVRMIKLDEGDSVAAVVRLV